MIKLPTNRQREYLELIYEFHLINEIYPTAQDLAKLLVVSPSAVHYSLKTLTRDKWITINKNKILGLKSKTLQILSS